MIVTMARIHQPESSEVSAGSSLQKKYESAIDCLLHCEHIISDLQEQIDSKDRQIKDLEERIVKMSLELASSKAREDEHQMLKRRMSEGLAKSLTDSTVASSIYEDGHPRRFSRSLPLPGARDQDLPLLVSARVGPARCPARPSSEAEATSPNRAGCASIASQNSIFAAAGVGLGRLRQRASWKGAEDEPPDLDSSFGDSSRGTIASSWIHGRAGSTGGRGSPTELGIVDRYESSPFVAGNDKYGSRAEAFSLDAQSESLSGENGRGTGGGALVLNFPCAGGRRGSCAEGKLKRSMTNIGQLLRGMNKVDLEDDDSIAARGNERQQRRQSSRSFLSGVVFPVSSDDCLEGLSEGKKEGRPESGECGGCSSADGNSLYNGDSANGEWPELR